MTSIESSAFSECDGITVVNVLCSQLWVGLKIFDNCNNIEEAVYDCYKVPSILNGNTSLKKITLKESVIEIGMNAFSGCSGLTSVTIPSSVTVIGMNAFSGCSGLTSVTIPSSVTEIGINAFSGCSSLASVTIPNSVTKIGMDAFNGCSGLTSVTIGSGVTSIGSGSFSGTNLKKTIWLTNTPPSGSSNASGTINYVANDQFSSLGNKVVYQFLSSMFEVDGIKYVPVSPSDRTCDAIDCVYNESAANTKITSMVSYKNVAMTVNNMQPYVAYGNNYIQALYIDYDGEISDNAFEYCSNMKSVELGNKVTSIGQYAFNQCSNLESAKLESGTILRYAFAECKSLKTIALGNEITTIGDNSFKNCTSLENLVVPDAVTTIGKFAFLGCTGLTSAIIGDGVTSIGEYAFSGCTSLVSSDMGSCGGIINSYAFEGCSSLSELIIGSHVTTISNSAFLNCKTLPAITIPKSVTQIGNNVFSGCEGLKKVVIADREDELALGSNGSNPLFSSCPINTVYIGGNISYRTESDYGYSPFYRNTYLQTIQITDKETEISENEFYGCSNLQTVRIGDGVTTIGNWAFSGCKSLNFFVFGSHVSTIGQEAFSDCTALTEISSKAYTPPVCGFQALDDINKWECKLIVPKDRASAYQGAEQWKDFFFIEEGEPSYSVILGDANGNGYVDENDINAIVDYIMNGKMEGFIFDNADMNGDQKINASDIVLILNIINTN